MRATRRAISSRPNTPTTTPRTMAWTGGLALALMAVHAAWAIGVLVRGRESELAGFHKLSLWVWLIWLVPYVTGMLSAMV